MTGGFDSWRVLLGWGAALLLLGWLAMALWAAGRVERLRPRVRSLVDLAAVLLAVGFAGSYFPPSLMLAATITSGGDTGSHFYPALFMRETLLPHGQLAGWCPGNYCGFPMFQFYFPLPFVLMQILAAAMPLTVAFKLVTALGTVLLPPAAYFALRAFRVPFPGPALGALFPLAFLFMEANSMWGGNIPSTLAGEFSYSLALALALVLVGWLHRTLETGRGHVRGALLVVAIALSHGYALLWAGVSSLAELAVLRGSWRRLGTLAVVYGLAILLLGSWLVPLLAYAPWTTAHSPIWLIKDWREVLPPILWPAAALAVASAAAVAVISLLRREAWPRGLALLWGGNLAGLGLYLSARHLHVVDIRFLPFVQLGLCLGAAAGVGYLLARAPAPEIWVTALGLATVLFVRSQVGFVPGWMKWNYEGYEAKAAWPDFRAVNDHLRGDHRDPRVVFEHSGEYSPIGTVRAFENLPLFSGRSTLEGLYMQASPISPFVFFTQSEISKQNSCPFGRWGCSRFDLDRGVEHLRMFNVSQLVARSEQLKAAAAKHPGLEREAEIGPFQVYRVRENDGRYAVPLRLAPALVVAPDWKEAAYRWFKGARPEDPPVVFAERAGPEERSAFPVVLEGLPAELPQAPLGPPPELHEQMETDRIVVTGCRPGHPVLVRISYHPRWRSLTGERVWLAAPAFMLVFPKGERVELVYGGGPPVALGHILTLLGCALLVALALAGPRIGRLVMPVLRSIPVPELAPGARRAALAVALAMAALASAAAAVSARSGDAETRYRRGQGLFNAQRFGEALPELREAQRLSPLANTAVHSLYLEATILLRQQRWEQAEEAFQRFLDEFPEAVAAPEALYQVGVCRDRRGDPEGAARAWREVAGRFPGTHWAGEANKRAAQ